MDPVDGYHWFRLDADGTTFIGLREEGRWWLPGVPGPFETLEDNATYLRPVEPSPHN